MSHDLDHLALRGPGGSLLDSIPIVIDENARNFYLANDHQGRPMIMGSTSSFGALFAISLAAAYRPEGIPWISM